MSKKQLVLGKYQVLEQLGRGGFAVVYRARNMGLGNEVVLKVLNAALAEDETFVRRFRQEAQQMVRLDHPNIVRVLDLEKFEDKLFIVMEYVPGQNLRDLLAKRSLSLEQAAAIVRQMGAALDYAHSRKLVHRDIKPSNILMRDDGVAKLTDFGIVKAAEGARLTLTGTTIGTPTYMSPEQSRGAKVDGRSDIYSLGIVAFELITGQVPFQGDTAAVIYKQIHEQPPLPSQVTARARGPLEPVLLKALAKEPPRRYQTGATLATALVSAVKELQSETLVTIYDKTVVLVEQHQFSDALQELESLNAVHPGYKNVADLLARAREGLRLTEMYQKAAEHLRAARDLVTEITTTHPQFPDTEQVIQTFHRQRESGRDGRVWFRMGAAAVITAYFSTTWQWITEIRPGPDVNTIEETRLQIEGIAVLAVPEAPWVIWPPLICVVLALLLTWLPARRTDDPAKARPPIDRTEVWEMDAPKRPSRLGTAFKWVILLAGLIFSLFLVASVRNLVGPVTIAAGIGIMLLTEIVSVFRR